MNSSVFSWIKLLWAQRQCRHREPRDLPNVGATAWDTLTGHHSANRFDTRET
jgi:hypothetical protein